jgi:hypothetical protein
VTLLLLPGRWPLLSWIPFGIGAWHVLRLPRRTALVLILAGGALLPLAASLRPPGSSDDMYRYVWDGRVQVSGIDPYRYPPASPELAHLRDGFLWPPTSNWCVPGGCTLINRPTVPTIYPPVAEAVFVAVDVVSPTGARERPMQLIMAACAFGLAIFLWYALRTLGRDPRRAVLWAWCPLVALETGNNAHVEAVAVLLSAVALWLLARARTRRTTALGAVVLGLAVATKLTPGLLVPAVLRRRPLTVVLACIGAVLTVYLPHILAVGPAVLGYLPGYLHEEGFTHGARYGLLPGPIAEPAAIAILAAAALRVAFTADPDRPWRGAAQLVAVSLLVTTPNYPWYVLLLVMLIAFGAPAEWLILAPAAYLAQFAHDLALSPLLAQRLGYGTALAVILTGLAIRTRHANRGYATRGSPAMYHRGPLR